MADSNGWGHAEEYVRDKLINHDKCLEDIKKAQVTMLQRLAALDTKVKGFVFVATLIASTIASLAASFAVRLINGG